jgi:solute carrier family 25 carnitine/acylcarnitine transporter 20/29
MDNKVSTSISVFGRTAASVLAGGVGSAIGVFVAYPIDVLKTKAQIKACNNIKNSTIKNDSVFETVRNIYRIKGISGFFNGVLTTMIGNALVSAVSFSANELAISVLNATSLFGGGPDSRAVTPFIVLLLAACFSGFVQTFVVIPVGESAFFVFFSA